MYRHLVLNDQFCEVNDVLAEENNEYDNYDLAYYPKIVIDLFDITSNTKLPIIFPSHYTCLYIRIQFI